MKNIILSILTLIIIPCLAQGQELKKITREVDPTITEEFYVLKKNREIKHGWYKKTLRLNQCIEEGYYKTGKRDSLWKTTIKGSIVKIGNYKDDRMHGIWKSYAKTAEDKIVLKDSGTYNLGNKIGIWNHYDKDGKPELIYNYDKKERIFQKADSTIRFFVSGKDTLAGTLDQAPIYMDGWSEFYTIIARNFRLPKSFFSRHGGFKSKVLISFYINENGAIEEVKSISKTDKQLNKQAISAILASNTDRWLPGIYQGKPVKTQVIIPFDLTNYGVFRN